MREENRINTVKVLQYMDVINNPPKSEEEEHKLSDTQKAILNRFRNAAQSNSYRDAKNWEDEAWGCFSAILIVFQYLTGAEEATNLIPLFRRFLKDKKLNPDPNKAIQGTYSEIFIFGESKYNIVKKEDPNLDAEDNFDIILEGCTEEDTVETVIRRIEPYVMKEKLLAFRDMAYRGFDVGSPLLNNCTKLYRAGARQIVFTGAPGTGKSYTSKKFAEYKIRAYMAKKYAENQNEAYLWNDEKLNTHVKTVQFHSGYDYSDFVEGLRPVQTAKNGEMTFVRLDGQFKAFCREILRAEDQNAPYFFIIDEINRADLSRVFGELMYCLDESKRSETERVQTQYSNLPTYQIDKDSGIAAKLDGDDCKDDYKDGFYIPENLCILATMNDIDRSVETFDFALRRRFKWIEAKANEEMEPGLLGMLAGKGASETKIKELAENAREMNRIIASKDSAGEKLRLTKDYHIGHAYFEKFDGKNLPDIWETQIEQILREYCRGRSKTEEVEAFIGKCHDELFPKEKNNR